MKVWSWVAVGIAALGALAGVICVLAHRGKHDCDEFDTYQYYGE